MDEQRRPREALVGALQRRVGRRYRICCLARLSWNRRQTSLGVGVSATGASNGLGPASELQLQANKDLFARALANPEEKAAKFADHLFGLDAPRKWLMLDGVAAR